MEPDATVQCLWGFVYAYSKQGGKRCRGGERALSSCVCERGLDAGAGRQCTGQRLLRVYCRLRRADRGVEALRAFIEGCRGKCITVLMMMISIQALAERTQKKSTTYDTRNGDRHPFQLGILVAWAPSIVTTCAGSSSPGIAEATALGIQTLDHICSTRLYHTWILGVHDVPS